MFTGIIEATGRLEAVTHQGANTIFWISSPLAPELTIDQSLSHDGTCLTIEQTTGNQHRVTAIAETLEKTNLGQWKIGRLINLERCMQLNGRLDGHIVQGHVDATGTCTSIKNMEGSWEYRFTFSPAFAPLMIEKGSICVNGISLTAFDVTQNEFSVAIIPYTHDNTNLKEILLGESVNLEFDIIGKYLQRRLDLASAL